MVSMAGMECSIWCPWDSLNFIDIQKLHDTTGCGHKAVYQLDLDFSALHVGVCKSLVLRLLEESQNYSEV